LLRAMLKVVGRGSVRTGLARVIRALRMTQYPPRRRFRSKSCSQRLD
jgi:hypothetical protein